MGGLKCKIFKEVIPSKANVFAFDPLSHEGYIANNIDYLRYSVNSVMR